MANITVSGLGSGMDYDSWITQLVAIKQGKIDAVSKQIKGIEGKESSLSSIKTYYNDLKSSISALANTTSSSNVFKQKNVTSSSDAITAKVDSTATNQAVKVTVASLATATTAKSVSAVGSYVDGSTKISEISEGAAKEGTFSVYVGGVKNTISITSDQTLDNLLTSLNGISGVSASLTDGKLTISKSGTEDITVGSSSDTSNFSKVMSLTRDVETGIYSSSKSIFDTDTSAALTGTPFANGAVTEGTFTIGNAEFTISSSTTLDSLITQINNNADAGAKAYWDSNSGKLVLTATEEGASNINIEAGTSNFTDMMGLTTAGGIASGTQTLGTNAVLTINGTTITSSSNTITSDISGITGLTLTLSDEVSSDATINITNDTSAMVDAITETISKYNMALSNTKSATSSDGALYGQSILAMLPSNIAKTASGAVSFDNTYKTLASIGITTGAFTTDVSKNTTQQLTIDKDKLTVALQNDPESVMKLLVGDDVLKTNGALTKIGTTLDNYLNVTNGYFTKQNDSYERQIDNLDKKVDKMNLDLEKYRTQLEAKFQAMDTLISNLKQSSAVFDSYFNKKSSDSNS